MSTPSKPSDFTQKLSELEAITEWFESGEVDLNQALTKFERGMELTEELKKQLQDVENRVQKIRAKFDGTAPHQDAEVLEPPLLPE
ncbi:MAG TPA: exodeoxyribonuclease VII small subunit [Candidatus Saccharimonadia bacterium]